jgi:hypothetical protein
MEKVIDLSGSGVLISKNIVLTADIIAFTNPYSKEVC